MCVHACVHVCVRVCVHVCVPSWSWFARAESTLHVRNQLCIDILV